MQSKFTKQHNKITGCSANVTAKSSRLTFWTTVYYKIVLQAFSVVRFLLNFPFPVGIFVYCYGQIFHTIRRQSKVIVTGRGQGVTMGTTSRDQAPAEQQQQQATGGKLSHTEMNVLQTMTIIIVVFVLCWSVTVIANFLQLLGVSACNIHIIVTFYCSL